MKILSSSLIISLLIFSCQHSSFAQNRQDIVDTIFESRKVYILNEVPDTFLFYYQPFIELNNQLIIDTLKQVFNSEKIQNEHCYLIEYIPDDYRSKIYGVIWSDKEIISFKWDNIEKKLEIIKGKFLEMSKPYVENVEKWDEFVTNRSYYYTSIAGAWYVLCSRIIYKENQLYINHAAFREYNKDHFEFYLKESSNNNYRSNRVRNPDFKESN